MATHLAIVIIGVSVVLDGAAKELALKPPSETRLRGGGVDGKDADRTDTRGTVGHKSDPAAEHGPDLTATEMRWRLFITLRSAVGGYWQPPAYHLQE